VDLTTPVEELLAAISSGKDMKGAFHEFASSAVS